MNDKINNIKLLINDLQEEINEEQSYLSSLESENIKKLSKIIEKSNTYSPYEWNTSYGIKNTQDRINLLFEIILEQNKRISKIEKLINSTSIYKSSPNTVDVYPDLRESTCCDNNNHRDSKEL